MKVALQHLINHVSLVVDKSGSMSGHANRVVEVFDRELNSLKQRSVDANQETRISIYLFDQNIEVLTFDMDVMRFTSLKGYYKIGGQTALIDATLQSIEDNKKLPELYGDHAFLTYVITDGQENASRKNGPNVIQNMLSGLKDNWTTAILVPDKNGVTYAQRYGFNAGSISVWDTSSSHAIENVGQQFSTVMDSYFTMRSRGVRGTKTLFDLNPGNLGSSVKTKLAEVSPLTYEIFPVHKESPIREYVESWTKQKYVLGSSYYQPTKPVTIQDYKKILVQDAKTGKVYEGNNVRELLGLPAFNVGSLEVNPVQHPDWRLFVQSTSTNRKLYPNTFVLVRR